MASSLVYEMLTEGHCKVLCSLDDSENVKRYISEHVEAWVTGDGPWCVPEKERILYEAQGRRDTVAEMVLHMILMCWREEFNNEKLSSAVSILWVTHLTSMSRRYTMEEAAKFCHELLVVHSVDRPPKSILLFNLYDVKAIHNYILTTYLRHYLLYLHTFSIPVSLSVRAVTQKNVVPSPPPFRPLRFAKEVCEQRQMTPSNDGLEDSRKLAEDVAGTPSPVPSPRNKSNSAECSLTKLPEEQSAVAAQNHPAGLKHQLQAITDEVATLSAAKLDELETRIQILEAKNVEHREKFAKGKKK